MFTYQKFLRTGWVACVLVAATPSASPAATVDKFTELNGPATALDATNAAGAAVDAWTVTAPPNTGSGTRTYTVPYWNLFSNPITTTGGPILQTHVFDSALDIGQTASIDFVNRNPPPAGSGRALGLRFLDAAGGTQVEFSLISDNSKYRYFDTGSGTFTDTSKTAVNNTPFNVAITLTGTSASATTYTGTAGAATWTGSFTSPITQIQVFNNFQGGGSDVSTNNLAVTPEPASLGLVGVLGALSLLRRRRRPGLPFILAM